MTLVKADIKDSNQPLTGYITVQLEYPIVDSGILYTSVLRKIPLVNGLAEFELEPSEVAGTLYVFNVYQTIPDEEDLPVVPQFKAKVPDLPEVNLADLASTTGVSRDRQDSSIVALTRRLYNDSDFWANLQANLFSIKGTYNSTSWYTLGDIVQLDGSSYLCKSQVNIQGIPVSDNTNWQILVARGATGTGTQGNDLAYNASTWKGQLDAPSRNAVSDAIETLAKNSDLDNYVLVANLANFSFTAPSVSTPTASDNSTRIPNTSWIRTNFAKANDSQLTGNPVATSPVANDNSNRIATTSWLWGLFTETIGSNGQILWSTPKFKVIACTQVVTLDTSSNSVVTFVTPFSNLYTVLAVNGDAVATTTSPQIFGTGNTGFNFVVPGRPSTSYRINWLAIGK